jgi:hypothetical protein
VITPAIKFRWTKMNTEAILGRLAVEIAQGLSELKVPIKSVIARNVGTQYFTLSDLARLGHPYRLGGGGRPGGLPAGVVNRQSGEFYRSIVVRGPLISKDRILITVFSRGEKEKGDWLLTGTGRMRGRSWTTQLNKEIQAVIMPAMARIAAGMRTRLRVKV